MKNLNINNPLDSTLQFLTIEQDNPTKKGIDDIPENSTRKPVPIQDRPKTDKNGKELKRKRYNLLLVPSLYEEIEKIAYVKKISANEAINRALALYRENEKEALVKYTEIEKLKAHETEMTNS